MGSYEFACYLILGGVIFLTLLFLVLYLVKKYRDNHNNQKRG